MDQSQLLIFPTLFRGSGADDYWRFGPGIGNVQPAPGAFIAESYRFSRGGGGAALPSSPLISAICRPQLFVHDAFGRVTFILLVVFLLFLFLPLNNSLFPSLERMIIEATWQRSLQ